MRGSSIRPKIDFTCNKPCSRRFYDCGGNVMQRERNLGLAEIGGLLLVLGIGAQLVLWIGRILQPLASGAIAVGVVLLILGLVLPRRR